MSTRLALLLVALLTATSVTLQVWRDRGWQPYEPATPVLWLQAGPATARASLGFNMLVADLYWIRAVVYFGRQSLSDDPDKNYDLLYPLLDLVTTLDPRFMVAYRFGAIFLSEPAPDGPGRPDLAIRLLQRGAAQAPDRWEYLHDLAFVYYWHHRDFATGARWMERASEKPDAPFWLKSTAASMHTEGGDRASARMLWRQLYETADNDLLRSTAQLRLAQFEAMDAIDRLNEVLWRFEARAGRMPTGWDELIQARWLRAIPVDPTGIPYEIDPQAEVVRVARRSALSPMPQTFGEVAR